MNKTSFGVFAILIAVLLGIFASELVTRQPKKNDRVQVIFWAGWTNFEADAMREVIAKFNKSQDRIEVNFLSVSGIQQKTLVATSAGIPPDLALLGSPDLPMLAFQNAIEPLDELAAEYGISGEKYIPAYWDLLFYKEILWAMPATPAATALHRNKQMFREAGLDPEKPPITIEELDAMDQVILRKDPTGRILKNGFLPNEPGWWNWGWSYFFGGDLWDGKSQLTPARPENVRAYEWFTSYTKRYGLGTIQQFQSGFGGFDSPQNSFIAEKVAMVLQGVWMGNFILRHGKNMDWAPSAFPYPADRPDLAGVSCVEQDLIIIPRGAKNKEAAFEFLAFLQKQENMEMLCLGQAKHTPLLDVSDEFYRKHANPYIKFFRDAALSDKGFSAPRTPIWAEYSSELNVAIQKIALLQETPEVALQKVYDRIQPKFERMLQEEKIRFGK
ncbi:MAG: extracellular solute-binding protein [Fimbriimonadaceae bacterium]|jgi:ABC-type glycerol-3-phosphate transport system substrate-binding protein|nr:extracellular solute-binding protein [Fimbriimonadaceae bacterium]